MTGLFTGILCATVAVAEPNAAAMARFESLKIGRSLLARDWGHKESLPSDQRLPALAKALPTMDADAADRELDALERALFFASVGVVGAACSPNIGWDFTPGQQKNAFWREVRESRQELQRTIDNLLRHGIHADCSTEFARMDALCGTTNGTSYVDGLLVQGFFFYRKVCEERLRLGAQIRNWAFARDGLVRTADFRRALGESVGSVEIPLARFREVLDGYERNYRQGRLDLAAGLEPKVERALEDLRAAVFAGEAPSRRIRPGLSFRSCGAFGFGGKWQTCLNFNVRNASIFRPDADDFSLYRDMRAEWAVDFAPEGAVFDRFEMKEGGWTYARRNNVFKKERGAGERSLEVFWSELAPGILYRAPAGTDAVSVSAQLAAGPTAPDVVVGVFGGQVRVIRRGETVSTRDMQEGWLLFAWTEGKEPKLPVLAYFARRPEAVEWTAEKTLCVRAAAGAGVGDFAVTTLWGARPEARTSFDGTTFAQCRRVAALLANFPLDVEEFYAFEGPTRLKVWNRVTQRIDLSKEWGFAAPDYAPFVPLYTLHDAYVRPCEPVVAEAFPTRFGYYRVVAGDVISYVLPVPDLLERIPLRPVAGEEAYLGRMEGLVRRMTEDRRSWVRRGLSGDMMDAGAAFFLLSPDARRILDGNEVEGVSDLACSGEWNPEFAGRLHAGALAANFQVDPISGRGAFLAGWRGMNLGMPIRGDMTLFNYVPIYAAYGPAKLFGRWDLMRRHWNRFRELHEALDFSQTWRGPGVNTLSSGALVYGDMFGDGMRGEWIMYRAAQAMGDEELAARALYAVTKETATLVNCLSPQVKPYNAMVKNIAAAASPEACVGQLGFAPSGFRTAPWRPYSPEAWNAPFQTIGCRVDSPFFGILVNMARRETDAWLGDFTRAIPEWHEAPYLRAQKGERFLHALNHLKYLSFTTTDRAAVRRLAEDGVLSDACWDHRRLAGLLALTAHLAAQNDPIWIGEWGTARLADATYDRAARVATVSLLADRPERLTLVSKVRPSAVSVNGRGLPVCAGAFPDTWTVPLETGLNVCRVSLPDAAVPVSPSAQPLPVPRLPKAASPVLLGGDAHLPSRYQVGAATPLDLSGVVNAARSDTSPSGATDEQWKVPLSDVVRGVPFAFVDEGRNGGKGMLQLGNWQTRKEKLPRKVTIPVGRRVKRLFFLHGLGYTSAKYFGTNGDVARKGDALRYTFHFRDAPPQTLVLREGVEIGSWKVAPGCKGLSEVPYALTGNVYPAAKPGQYGEGIGGYVTCWENRVLAAGVTNQDVEQRSLAVLESITAEGFWNSVPIILAITAED